MTGTPSWNKAYNLTISACIRIEAGLPGSIAAPWSRYRGFRRLRNAMTLKLFLNRSGQDKKSTLRMEGA